MVIKFEDLVQSAILEATPIGVAAGAHMKNGKRISKVATNASKNKKLASAKSVMNAAKGTTPQKHKDAAKREHRDWLINKSMGAPQKGSSNRHTSGNATTNNSSNYNKIKNTNKNYNQAQQGIKTSKDDSKYNEQVTQIKAARTNSKRQPHNNKMKSHVNARLKHIDYMQKVKDGKRRLFIPKKKQFNEEVADIVIAHLLESTYSTAPEDQAQNSKDPNNKSNKKKKIIVAPNKKENSKTSNKTLKDVLKAAQERQNKAKTEQPKSKLSTTTNAEKVKAKVSTRQAINNVIKNHAANEQKKLDAARKNVRPLPKEPHVDNTKSAAHVDTSVKKEYKPLKSTYKVKGNTGVKDVGYKRPHTLNIKPTHNSPNTNTTSNTSSVSNNSSATNQKPKSNKNSKRLTDTSGNPYPEAKHIDLNAKENRHKVKHNTPTTGKIKITDSESKKSPKRFAAVTNSARAALGAIITNM